MRANDSVGNLTENQVENSMNGHYTELSATVASPEQRRLLALPALHGLGMTLRQELCVMDTINTELDAAVRNYSSSLARHVDEYQEFYRERLGFSYQTVQ